MKILLIIISVIHFFLAIIEPLKHLLIPKITPITDDFEGDQLELVCMIETSYLIHDLSLAWYTPNNGVAQQVKYKLKEGDPTEIMAFFG